MKTELIIEELDPIEIYSFQQQVSQPVSGLSRTGGRTGSRCDFSDIVIKKNIDHHTPMLFAYCCSGQHIPNVKIKVYNKEGGNKFTVSINDAIITSQLISNDEKEVITIAYGKIKLKYIANNKEEITRAWNLEINKEE